MTGKVDESWVADGLMYAIRALASAPEILTRTYPPFVCIRCQLLHEFANFHAAYFGAKAEAMADSQRLALAGLVHDLEPLAGPDGLCVDVPLDGDGWTKVRAAALRALGVFSWEYAFPPECTEVSPGHWQQDRTGSSWVTSKK